MENFDPKKYLEESEAFDPQAYLAEEKSAFEEPSMVKDFVRATKGSLPLAGSLALGVLAGGPTLGTAALVGSALGAMLGKAAENVVDKYYLGEEKPIEDQFKDIGKEAIYDVVGNVTGEKVIAHALKGAGSLLGTGYKKASSYVTKIPEQSIETLYKNYDQVTNIPDVAFEADAIRDMIQKDIKTFKTSKNVIISDALNQKGSQKVDAKGMIDTLRAAKDRIDPNINPEWHNRLQKEIDVIDKIRNVPEKDQALVDEYLKQLDLYEKEAARYNNSASFQPVDTDFLKTQYELPSLPTRQGGAFNAPRGDDLLPMNQNLSLQERAKAIADLEERILNSAQLQNLSNDQSQMAFMTGVLPETPKLGGNYQISARQMQQLTQRLQDLADYTPDRMALKRKDLVDVVMSRAAGKGKKELSKVAPEIAEANRALAQLHNAGKNINKNMITSDKPYSSMMGAGTGENKMAVRQLENFQNVLGKDYLSPMQNLASAQYFNNAGLLPGEKTGSALAPLMISGSFGVPDLLSGNVGAGASKMLFGLPFTPIGVKTIVGLTKGAQKLAGKAGITPTRIGSESVQAALPSIMPELFTPPPETNTQKAERLNEERKLLKGK